MKQPVVKAGGSLAVVLPEDLVRKWKLQAGAEVEIAACPDTPGLRVSEPVRFLNNGRVTADFIRIAEGVLEQFAEAWKRLA